MSENFSNYAVTLLSGTINNSQTTLTVQSASAFPTAPFRIVIDGEIMKVTGVAGNIFTVVRSAEAVNGSTVATSHNNGALVACVVTALQLMDMGGPSYIDVTLTNDQILDLQATPITIVPAPGAGYTVIPVAAYLIADTTNGRYDLDSNDHIIFKYDYNPTNAIVEIDLSNGPPTSGSFTVHDVEGNFDLSDAINWNDTQAAIQTVMDNAYGPGELVVTGGFDTGTGPVLIEFSGPNNSGLFRSFTTAVNSLDFGNPDMFNSQYGGKPLSVNIQINCAGGDGREGLLDSSTVKAMYINMPLTTTNYTNARKLTNLENVPIIITMDTGNDDGDPSNYLFIRMWYLTMPYSV